jgi:serine/threonine protein phosphatase PrpC
MRRLQVGTAATTAVGEIASADRHLVKLAGSKTVVAVVDGLGHGDAAVHAALAAVGSLEAQATTELTAMVQRTNEQLRSTRGVVLSIAIIDLVGCRLSWVGVGNVAGVVVRGIGPAAGRRESLLSSPGIVGTNLPVLHPSSLQFDVGDTLVFATDGVDEMFENSVVPGMPVQRLAQHLLAAHGQQRDDCLVFVARLVEDAP